MDDTRPNWGRELARLRWGTTVIDRAVDVVAQRSAELTPEHRARLREIADQKEDGPWPTTRA